MPLLIIVGIATLLWVFFPKPFKITVGFLVGLATGGLCWAFSAMVFSGLVTVVAFALFIVVGSVLGMIGFGLAAD